MKFFSLTCNCGCGEPLIAQNDDGREIIPIFRTKEAAQIEASGTADPEGKSPLVAEFEVRKYEKR